MFCKVPTQTRCLMHVCSLPFLLLILEITLWEAWMRPAPGHTAHSPLVTNFRPFLMPRQIDALRSSQPGTSPFFPSALC